MQRLSFLCPLVIIAFIISSCNSSSEKTKTETPETNAGKANLVDGHPDWIMQGNIYEVNVRQYTPEGTFRAFEKHLDRLKQMGVQTLWFMPINPISKADHKGAMGSYYAVADYTKINPEFGTLDDWKVVIDWVAPYLMIGRIHGNLIIKTQSYRIV